MEEPLPNDEPGREHERTRLRRRAWLRIGGALALGVLAAAVVWALIDRSDSGSTSTTAPTASVASATVAPIDPIGLSALDLRKLAASVGQPIYWKGPEPGHLYELTRTNTGKVFVRYLPLGVRAGSNQATYLIVATYPFQNPFAALEHLPGSHPVATAHGGIAVVDRRHPTSVHVAFPNVDYQIEVYDPEPARALAVARSGAVQPVPPPR